MHKIIIIFLKNLDKASSSLSMRLVKLTGKNRAHVHPKHLISNPVWYERLLKPSDVALDVGCNLAQQAIKVSGNVKKIYGYEINIELIKMAKKEIRRRKIKNIELNYGDANAKLPFKSNYFDVVVCSDVLEHLYNRNFAISEISRVLKPGGRLFLVTDNPDTSWKKLQKSHGLFYYADADHKYEYPKKEIISKLTSAKFKIKSVKTVTYDTPFKGLIDLITEAQNDLEWRRQLLQWTLNKDVKDPHKDKGNKDKKAM